MGTRSSRTDKTWLITGWNTSYQRLTGHPPPPLDHPCLCCALLLLHASEIWLRYNISLLIVPYSIPATPNSSLFKETRAELESDHIATHHIFITYRLKGTCRWENLLESSQSERRSHQTVFLQLTNQQRPPPPPTHTHTHTLSTEHSLTFLCVMKVNTGLVH